MKKTLPIIIMLSLLLSSCASGNQSTGKLQVYTSFYAMYEFADVIGGDDIELHNMVPTGAEPHEFEPTASDVAKLTKADVFIYNGAGMEAWSEQIAKTLPDSVNIVCASDALEIDEKSDSHTWLSPYNAQLQMQSIYEAFAAADSENAEKYLERLTEYETKINALADEYKNAGLDGKKIFVTHGAYSYLCNDFGMEQIALESVTGGGDPSPTQMSKIVEDIKESGAKCIFYDPLDGDKMAQAVAKEAGVEALPLYTFEGDSEERDYLTVMQLNLEQLKKSLS